MVATDPLGESIVSFPPFLKHTLRLHYKNRYVMRCLMRQLFLIATLLFALPSHFPIVNAGIKAVVLGSVGT